MKGKYVCPKCGKNDWNPVLDVDGPPYDECKNCGYKFTSKDVPREDLDCVICKKAIPDAERDFAQYPEYHPGILGPIHLSCYEKAVDEIPDLPWTDPISGMVDYREMGEAFGFSDPEEAYQEEWDFE